MPLDELPPEEQQKAEKAGLLPADVTQVDEVRVDPNPPASQTEATTDGTH